MRTTQHLVLAVAVVIGFSLAATPSWSAPKVSWNYYGIISTGHVFGKALADAFKRVEERTNGEFRVTFIHYGETPFKATDALRVLKDDLVQMTEWIPAYTTGTYPILSAPGLPFLPPELKDTGEAQRRGDEAWGVPAMQSEVKAIMGEHGGREIGRYYYEPMNFFCSKAVSSSGDLQGKRIRVFSPDMASLVKQLNGTPVSLPAPEVYNALQRGLLDCVITSSGGVTGLKWHEQLKSVYVVNMAMISTSILVREDALAKLPASYRTALLEEMGSTTSEMRRLLTESDAEHFATMKSMGFSVASSAGSDYQKMRGLAVNQVWPEWTDKVGDKGKRVLNEINAKLK